MKKDYIGEYGTKSPQSRFNILFREYSSFPFKIEAYRTNIILKISSEREFSRNAVKEGLGVRVQTSNVSNPTMDHAIEKMEIEAFIADENEDGVLSHLTCKPEIVREAREMRLMSLEYSAFEAILNKMPEYDKEIIIPFLSKKMDIDSLADEYNMSYEAMRSRLRKIKSNLSNAILSSMYEYDDEILIISGGVA